MIGSVSLQLGSLHKNRRVVPKAAIRDARNRSLKIAAADIKHTAKSSELLTQYLRTTNVTTGATGSGLICTDQTLVQDRRIFHVVL